MDDGKPTGPQAKWWSRPTARRAAHPEPTNGPAPAGAPTPEEPAAPDQAPVPAPVAPDSASAPAEVAEVREPSPAAPDQAVPSPRPSGQPLHEPDEYRTPPYGGPGPW
ncbi:protease, partial [Streptomyces globisporus]